MGRGAAAKAESESRGAAGEEGQAQPGRPQGAACEPQPLTWSPHAGVNHAARPAGLGEQLCHLPALSGGQALAAGSHPGRKPQGPPPSEGKIPVPEGPPQPAADPKSSVCVCWGSGGWGGVERREAGRTDSAAMPPGGVPSPSAASTWPAHLEQGLWVWERRWTPNTDTKTLARSLGRAFPNARPCLSHLTGIISEGAICPHFTDKD